MSGVELLGALKSLDPAIEVILLTAYETTDTLRQALRLGACDYLNKPFDIADIRAAVRNAIERRVLSEQMQRNAVQLGEIQNELQNQKMLEELSRSRGEIYASILHDINGPLTVISGFIQLMNQRIDSATKLEGEDLENLKNRQKAIARQVANCIDISRRYLGFLRQQNRSNAVVSVNQILSDVHDLARFHPSAGENELVLALLPEDTSVRINGTDLIQILLNLGVNAFQCTSTKHRVELRGQLLKAPLETAEFVDGPENRFANREEFQNQPPLVALSIADNGPGIPGDVLPRIFDSYFTTKAPGQGTGLGLSIVLRLIKEAKGGLHVKTRMFQGTTFTVFLPAVTTPT
jgi:signal transduction histidine kinase